MMTNVKWVVLSAFLTVFVLISSNPAFSAGTPQKRAEYARKYKDYYDRIQVGATAKAEGAALHIYLKYNLDDFVVETAKRYLVEWKELGFTKVIVSDKQKSWTESFSRNQPKKASSQRAESLSKQQTNILAKKMAVATYYQTELEKQYGRALVSVNNKDDSILQVSMVSISVERRNSILDSGLYEKAKGAKFKKIRFTDATQHESIVDIK